MHQMKAPYLDMMSIDWSPVPHALHNGLIWFHTSTPDTKEEGLHIEHKIKFLEESMLSSNCTWSIRRGSFLLAEDCAKSAALTEQKKWNKKWFPIVKNSCQLFEWYFRYRSWIDISISCIWNKATVFLWGTMNLEIEGLKCVVWTGLRFEFANLGLRLDWIGANLEIGGLKCDFWTGLRIEFANLGLRLDWIRAKYRFVVPPIFQCVKCETSKMLTYPAGSYTLTRI